MYLGEKPCCGWMLRQQDSVLPRTGTADGLQPGQGRHLQQAQRTYPHAPLVLADAQAAGAICKQPIAGQQRES